MPPATPEEAFATSAGGFCGLPAPHGLAKICFRLFQVFLYTYDYAGYTYCMTITCQRQKTGFFKKKVMEGVALPPAYPRQGPGLRYSPPAAPATSGSNRPLSP